MATATKEAEREGMAAAPPDSVPTDLLAQIRAALHDETAYLRQEIEALKRERANVPSFQRMQPPTPVLNPGQASRTVKKAGDRAEGERQIPVGARGLALGDQLLDAYPQRFGEGQLVRLNRDSSRGTGRAYKKQIIESAAGEIVKESLFPLDRTQGWKPAEERMGPDNTVRREERVVVELNWGQVIDSLPNKGLMRCETRVGKARCRGSFVVGDPCDACGEGPRIRLARYLRKSGEWKYVVHVPGMTVARQGDGFDESELLPA